MRRTPIAPGAAGGDPRLRLAFIAAVVSLVAGFAAVPPALPWPVVRH